MLADLPSMAAWRFVAAVDGFEVVYPSPRRIRGHTSAVEDGRAYAVDYEIDLDDAWRTREVRVRNDTLDGPRSTVLTSDGAGSWTVDGVAAPHLDGLVDVDLEASACTNTFPVHRLDLPVGEVVAAPAAYVQALDLSVRRLEQTYRRRDARTFDYTSEGGAFRAVLTYDASGLVVDYPGIAVRFA
ncbi:putative glycolipid-binding domain-containing protein [Cellulomonas sp. 179-A 9B4 NHS]|uniref:putative glycolipid-binding domain-containing protein n=1 Tax=Cellulomonas sp. 179-A 9B4 NHS TaxID=3142379 RepID=UPI0039A244E0